MGRRWKPKSPLELISDARGGEVSETVEDFRRNLKVSLEDDAEDGKATISSIGSRFNVALLGTNNGSCLLSGRVGYA